MAGPFPDRSCRTCCWTILVDHVVQHSLGEMLPNRVVEILGAWKNVNTGVIPSNMKNISAVDSVWFWTLSSFFFTNVTLIKIFSHWLVWLSCLECPPMHWKVVGLIPGQGTYPGCSSVPGCGVYRRQPSSVSHIDVSFSLTKTNKCVLGQGLKKKVFPLNSDIWLLTLPFLISLFFFVRKI